VPRSAWNIDAVDWLDGYAIAGGFDDGTFRWGEPVTRQQMVRWLWNTMGQPAATTDHPYTDVADGSWADGALDWAEEEGIVRGFPDGTFRPRTPINRGQLSAWLWALAGEPAAGTAHGFPDVPAAAWYGGALDWLAGHDIVAGFQDGTFRPKTDASRGQMANWLHLTVAAEADWA
jgi:endo-1,4-beta-xylanase